MIWVSKWVPHIVDMGTIGLTITAMAPNIDMGTHFDDMGTHIMKRGTRIDIGARNGLNSSYLLLDLCQ